MPKVLLDTSLAIKCATHELRYESRTLYFGQKTLTADVAVERPIEKLRNYSVADTQQLFRDLAAVIEVAEVYRSPELMVEWMTKHLPGLRGTQHDPFFGTNFRMAKSPVDRTIVISGYSTSEHLQDAQAKFLRATH